MAPDPRSAVVRRYPGILDFHSRHSRTKSGTRVRPEGCRLGYDRAAAPGNLLIRAAPVLLVVLVGWGAGRDPELRPQCPYGGYLRRDEVLASTRLARRVCPRGCRWRGDHEERPGIINGCTYCTIALLSPLYSSDRTAFVDDYILYCRRRADAASFDGSRAHDLLEDLTGRRSSRRARPVGFGRRIGDRDRPALAVEAAEHRCWPATSGRGCSSSRKCAPGAQPSPYAASCRRVWPPSRSLRTPGH